MGEILIEMKEEQRTNPASSSIGSSRCTRQSRNNWRKVKNSIKLDMTSTRLIMSSKVGDRVWIHISKERLKGEGKKIKPIYYGPFTILEKSGTNAFRLDIPTYMHIYSVVNIENFKLFEPPMIMDRDEEVSIPSVNEFSLEYLDELKEYIILERRMRTSYRGDVDYI
jgi:hypothetical protein